MEREELDKGLKLKKEIERVRFSLEYLYNKKDVNRLQVYFDCSAEPFHIGPKNASKVKDYIQNLTEEYLSELEQQFKDL